MVTTRKWGRSPVLHKDPPVGNHNTTRIPPKKTACIELYPQLNQLWSQQNVMATRLVDYSDQKFGSNLAKHSNVEWHHITQN